jgi:hypothetical protein
MAKQEEAPKSNKKALRQHNVTFQAVPEKEYEVIQYDNPEVVKKIEDQYPEMMLEFKRIFFTQYEIFCAKMDNYGTENISLGTKLETEEDIKMSLSGLWFRMNDKINRLKQLVVKGNIDQVGESIDDTYQDLSVYGIICQLVKNGKWGK